MLALAISDWWNKIGKAKRDDFFDAQPPISALRDHFVTTPDLDIDTLVYLPPVLPVANVACATVQSKGNTSIAKGMVQIFDKVCYIIKHDDCPPLESSKTKKVKKPPCDVVGYCICSADGHLTWVFRNKFYSIWKDEFKTAEKKLALKRRDIIIKMTASNPIFASAFDAAAARAAGYQPMDENLPLPTYWHIGFPCLSPFKLCFKELVVDIDPPMYVRATELSFQASDFF